MNEFGRYFSFESDMAIRYGMYSEISCPVSFSASAAHAVASYSQVVVPKHFELTDSSTLPNACADSVPSRT